MAKGNMLLGYSRGSVGDVVFYRDGGSQRQRARNRKPNNPNTEPQVKQRSKFANAVKFFKQVNSSFFKFAFEDKKTNESDYNAFMRHNVARSGYIGAAANKIANWPALGLWQMSDGSLPKISAPFPQPNSSVISFSMGDGISIPASADTIGAVSSALVASSNWREGDIVTFVTYAVTPSAGLPTVDTETTAYSASFGYAQFIVNSADTSPLPTLAVGAYSFTIETLEAGTQYLSLVFSPSSSSAAGLFGVCVIHSRNSSSGLLVSPSDLAWLDYDLTGSGSFTPSETPIAAMATNSAYYQQVLADWQAAALAVLQGGAVQSQAVSARITYGPDETEQYTHHVTFPGNLSLSIQATGDTFVAYITGVNAALVTPTMSGTSTIAFTRSTADNSIIIDFKRGESAGAPAVGDVLTLAAPSGNVVITFVA